MSPPTGHLPGYGNGGLRSGLSPRARQQAIGEAEKHSKNRDLKVMAVMAAVNKMANRRGSSTAGNFSGALFTVLLLAVFVSADSQPAWSQSLSASAATAHSEQSAVLPGAPASGNEAAETMQRNPSVPVIGAGDLLKVSVLGAPDSDQEVRVDASGSISLNLIGAVSVAGMTTEQAQAALAKKYVAGRLLRRSSGFGFRQGICHTGSFGAGRGPETRVYPVLGARTLLTYCHWRVAPHQKQARW